MKISSKRAEYVALTGLIFGVLFFIITWLLGDWSSSFAISALSWQILGGSLIWFVLVIQFHQRGLAEREKLDMAQLGKTEGADKIFQSHGEHAAMFMVAQNRLKLFEKWFLPIFAGLTAIYQAGMGAYLLSKTGGAVQGDLGNILVTLVYMVGIAFLSFLVSRGAIGMSSEAEWKPLKAGGSNLLITAVLAFAIAIGLGFAHFKIFIVLGVLNWVVPVLLFLLGAEAGLNVVLDIYRPRLKGRYSRAAFDSRLLGLISEPGGILHTVASAIDYQFGFKVSQTWFYKLLEKAIVPLILFLVFSLYAVSCIVVIGPGEEAIIEHFGKPINEGAPVGSGLSFKWPWPVDIVYKYPTKRIQQINIGFVEHHDEGEHREPMFWNQGHYEKEYDLLVATETEGSTVRKGAVPVSLIRASVPVQYRIKNLYDFIYNHSDSERVLETICYRHLVRFAASAKIETEESGREGASGQESILGAGRAEMAKILAERIQAAADEMGLGVEIVFLGLQGVHPPPQVAEDYQKVIGAVQKKQASILWAMSERDKDLTLLAGSVAQANELYNLAEKYQVAREKDDTAQIEQLGEKLDVAFGRAKGDIFATLCKSQSYAFERAVLAKATGLRFHSQVQAYKAAKDIYKLEQRLGMLEDSLEKTRKYILVADVNDSQVFIVDLKEKLTPSLYDLTTVEEDK